MSKINNQSNSLYNIEFVQDISHETAANYSGGADFTFDGTGDIVLFKDPGQQGQRIGYLNTAIGESINVGLFPDGTDTTFNDTASSFIVNEGTWEFSTDVDGGGNTGILAANTLGDFLENDDAVTSITRIA